MAWVSFFIAMAVSIIFVFVPGLAFFRGLRFSLCSSVCLSPLYSIAVYSVIAIAYDAAGVKCTWWLVFSSALMMALTTLLISHVVERTMIRNDRDSGFSSVLQDLLLSGFRFREVLVYCLVAFVLFAGIFILGLDGPGSYAQTIDTIFHLNTVEAFVDSGIWSSLGASPYAGVDSSIQPFEETGFYPSAWHCLVAMVAGACNATTAVSVNSVNAMLASVVFPCGVYFAMRVLFSEKERVVIWGALAGVCFAAFPWRFLYWGVLFPNLLAYCMVLPVAAVFILAVKTCGQLSDCTKFVVVFVLGLVSLVFSQTNAVFTVAVLLIPYCVYTILESLDGRGSGRHQLTVKVMATVCFLVFVGAIWVACFKMPFLQKVVSNTWVAICDLPQAIANVAFLSYSGTPAQIVLGILVVAGLFLSIRERNYRWLSASYAIMALMYVLNASHDGILKQVVTGFWYTDHNRVAANLVLASIPLAALGMNGVTSILLANCRKLTNSHTLNNRFIRRGMCGVCALLIAIAVFYPSFSIAGGFDVTTAVGYTRDRVASAYSSSLPNVYDEDERRFVESAMSVVPEGVRSANDPNDGSAFAYGVQGADVLYRVFFGYEEGGEREASVLIREKLYEVAHDANVRAAVEDLGIGYVLQLDYGDSNHSGRYLSEYDRSMWLGIDSISEATEGFELVMSEGDMRLYKIVGA